MITACDNDTAFTPAELAQSREALARYARTMRVPRRIYVGTIVLAVIAVMVLVRFAWFRGEIAHTTLITALAPAPSVALQTPSASLQRAWTSAEHAALGTPYEDGTVMMLVSSLVASRCRGSAPVVATACVTTKCDSKYCPMTA